jgi:hypothetical protein
MSTVQHYRAGARRGPASWLADAIVAVLVMSWWKRLCCAAVLVGVVSLAAHLFGAISVHLGSTWHKEPLSAIDRSLVFVRSWIAGDATGMNRFVRAADQSKLPAWLAANPVPAALAELGPTGCRIKIISAIKDDMDGTVIKVRVSDAAAPAKDLRNSGGLVLPMAWSFTGGHWMFTPDASQQNLPLRSAASTLYAQRPASVAVAQPQDIPELSDGIRSAAPVARNVVIPAIVPPWQRSR